MPSKISRLPDAARNSLIRMGTDIAERRRGLGLTQASLAAAAHLSRVTVARIEAGTPTATVGAYATILHMLGLTFGSTHRQLPTRITDPVATPLPEIEADRYPQLRSLMWSIPEAVKSVTLTGPEALSIYERNWGHLDLIALSSEEQHLIDKLRERYGKGVLLV